MVETSESEIMKLAVFLFMSETGVSLYLKFISRIKGRIFLFAKVTIAFEIRGHRVGVCCLQ